MFTPSKTKKILLKFFIVLFILVQSFSFLLIPTPAKAVGAPDVVALNTSKWTWEKIQKGLISAAMGSALHASSYFFRKIAYDTATWIASGAKGQNPLAFDEGSLEYLKGVAGDAAGDAISKLGGEYGLNLCATPDLATMPFIQIGLHSLYADQAGGGEGGPKSDCSWKELSGAWSAEAFEKKYGPGGSKYLTENFNNAIRFEESDFGIAIGAKIKIDRNIASAVAGGEIDQMVGDGFKPVTSLISGKVTDPAQLVKKESESITNAQGSELTSTQLAGVYGSGLLQVIPMAASVFLNTLTSKGIQKLQRDLLNYNWGKDGGSEAAGVLSFESSGFQSSRKRAEAIFSDFLAVNIVQINNYNILEEFSACPDYPVRPGLNNCVMDLGMREALEESNLGEPLTIDDAIAKGYLKGEWFLISPERTADILDKDCYLRAFCYTNIQKLRRSRILPLGFEIAATLADPDDPKAWTLEKVKNNFYTCPEPGIDGKIRYDSNFPYCHLIDPNWVLKAPDSRCNAEVYSSNLADDNNTGIRAQECVDIQTCIKEDEDGNCDFYGYCTKEKNVWRFDADKCEEQNNTCKTFVSSEGDINSYLARTLDFGQCNVDSVGCTAYSTEEVGDTWVASVESEGWEYQEEGRNQTIFFNSKIDNYTCSELSVGCNEFYLGEENLDGDYVNKNNLKYFKKAPEYLGCYDIDPTTPKVDWPQTAPQLLDLDLDPDSVEACSGFAQVCLPSEVECDSYEPLSGPSSIDIPGVIGNNYCNASCVGYETFRQGKTAFEPSEFPLYFIPDEATSCLSEFDGCDEFTNIDELSKGGEALEYYSDLKYCERPEDDNQKVFYSWEGSKTEGYVLKLHTLRPINQDDFDYLSDLSLDLTTESGKTENISKVFPTSSPAYANELINDLDDYYESCNEESYNSLINKTGVSKQAWADCRALYDREGNVFYRILSETITVADECHPLRKTNSNLYVDVSIAVADTAPDVEKQEVQDFCVKTKGGVWGDVLDDDSEEPVCQRCYAGGDYDNGTCIYWAIDAPGESHSCFADVNGCREYRGNAASNLEIVASSDFDVVDKDDESAMTKAESGWEPKDEVIIASESIQVGLTSLQVNGSKIYNEIDVNELIIGDIFKLSFWAKGDSEELSIYFEQGGDTLDSFTFDMATDSETKISIGSDWRLYNVGPVSISNLDDEGDNVHLVFDTVGNNPNYFIDNLELSRVSDSFYRIKNSWKQDYEKNGIIIDVPLDCDDTPNDPFPGIGLGCSQYKEESTGRENIYAVGFDSLCRDEAVGCRAFFDTQNSSQSNKIIYNLWCVGDQGKNCELTYTPPNASGLEILGTCFVSTGETGCFVEGPINGSDLYSIDSVEGEINNAVVTTSTVIIPADTPYNKPIYLTYREQYTCEEIDKGCQKVALESQVIPDADNVLAYEFSPTSILNDPDNYDETLCRSDLVGCGDFTAGSEKYFFKDPVVTGNSFCEYKDEITVDDLTYSGWFLAGVGYCVDSDDICASDDDCGEGVSCERQGQVPCYNNYQIVGGEYGVWSNSSPNYDGRVGVCPASENGCSELIDPQDSSDLNPDGQPYYVIFNDKLTKPVGECESQASLKEGCVLFDKTDKPNLLYNSGATYTSSKNKDFALVNMVTTGNKDTNTLLKVIHDRECGEWLSCQGYNMVNDTQSEGNKRRVCMALQACQDGSSLKCDSVAPADEFVNQILTTDLYIDRNISWQEGRDLSGYSLFNQFQIRDLDFIKQEIDDGITKDSKVYLGYIDKDSNLECEIKQDGDDDYCGLRNIGICVDSKCVYPSSGYYKNIDEFEKELYNQECRGYPEEDSPFVDDGNKNIVEEWDNSRPQFSDAAYVGSNICQLGEDCSCDYLRAGYGESGLVSEEKFFEFGDSIMLDIDLDSGFASEKPWDQKYGICQGGERDGGFCEKSSKTPDLMCPGGECSLKLVQRSERIGWKGYCLERDISRHVNGRVDNANDAFACLTWLPLDSVPSAFDIFNSDENIGYVPPDDGGKAYCTEMVGWQDIEIYDGNGPLSFNCDLTTNNNLNDALKSSFAEGGFGEFCSSGSDYVMPDILKVEDDIKDSVDVTCNSSTPEDLEDCPFASMYYRLYNYPFRALQELAWTFINPEWDDIELIVHKFGTTEVGGENFNVPVDLVKNNYYNPRNHFLSRVDIAVNPGDPGDSLGGITQNQFNNSYPSAGKIFVSFMATGGYGGNTYAPLFPDRESYGIKWVDEYASPLTTTRETVPIPLSDVGFVDVGIIKHEPNRVESFLTRDMIDSVSLVPLWAGENGDDAAENAQIPRLGKPLTIVLSDDYAKVGSGDEVIKRYSSNTDFNDAKYFGNHWVLKDNTAPEGLVGYTLVWWAIDPKLNEEKTSNEGTDYNNFYVESYNYTDDPFDPFGLKSEFTDKGDGASGNHLLAFQILFEEETGKFAGYRSRNLSWFWSKWKQWGYSTAVVFTLKPMCLEAVEVYNDEDRTNTNKAWTNKLWAGGGFDLLPIVDSNGGNSAGIIKRDMPANTFGSISNFGAKEWFRTFSDDYINEENPDHAGRPTLCLDELDYGNLQVRSKCRGPVMGGGSDFTYPGVTKNVMNTYMPGISNSFVDFEHSEKTIQNLFTKAFSVKSRLNTDNELISTWLDTSDPNTNPNDKTVDDYSYTDKALEYGTPPLIFYPAEYYNGVLDDYENKFSVNSVGSTGDKLYGKGSLPTFVSFYAWADHNQMPLRRIIVDWQDEGIGKQGSILGEAQGYYQNSKPYCQNFECVKGQDESLGLTCSQSDEYSCPDGYTCEEVDPKFGNLIGDPSNTDTCVEEPVKAFWNYYCDITEEDKQNYTAGQGVPGKAYVYKVKDIDNIDLTPTYTEWQELLASKFHGPDDFVCVYKPRVQVLDNWGWCTGTCGDGGKEGCYDEYINQQGVSQDHCAPEYSDSWVSYSDIIVVVP